MKQRSLANVVLLFIFTLGLYRLFWFVKTRKELMKSDKKIKIAHPILLFIPYILLIGSIVMVICASIRAEKTPVTCSTNSSMTTVENQGQCNNIAINPLYLAAFYLSAGLFLPLQAIWFWSYSQAIERASKDRISFPLALIVLLIVPDGLDILVLQDVLNKSVQQKA